MRNISGVSLIELLIAAVLIGVVVSVSSLILPRAMKASLEQRLRAEATQLATSKIQDLKTLPYPILADEVNSLTPIGAGYFSVESADLGCDCDSVDFADLTVRPPPYTDYVESVNYRFLRQVCINRVERTVGNVWVHHCPDANDFGYLNVRVRVTWIKGATTLNSPFIEMESIIASSEPQ